MEEHAMQPPAKPPRKPKAPTLRDKNWEPYRIRLTELYSSGTMLKDIKKMFEDEYDFHAELRQYKSRISKWKLDKNVKSKEMETIVRKQLQRQFLAPERPALSFSVRHTEVDTVKIQRWMRRHGVPDNAQYLPDTTASTPSAVSCNTMSDNGSPSVSALLPQLTSTPSSESSHSPIPGTKRVYSSLFVPELFNIWRDCFDVPDRELTTETEHEMIASYRGKTTSFLEIHGPLGTQRLLPSSLLLIPSYVPCPSPRILEAAIQCWLALGADVNFRYDNGLTPLSWVSLSLTPGIWRHLQLLIAHGADVHAVSADGGYGLLHVTLRHISTTHLADAASTADEEARLITLLEADCDPNARDHKGRTPPETVSLNEAAMRIWNKALQRVQRRKKMTARERDADLELRGARES